MIQTRYNLQVDRVRTENELKDQYNLLNLLAELAERWKMLKVS